MKETITFQAVIIVQKDHACTDGIYSFLAWLEGQGCRIVYGQDGSPAVIEKEFKSETNMEDTKDFFQDKETI